MQHTGQHHQGTLASVFSPKSLLYISQLSRSSPPSSACDSESVVDSRPPALTPNSEATDDFACDSHCRGSGDQNHQRSDVAKQQVERRMNRNGFERNGMTGSNTTTSENLTWLASASQAAAQAAAHQRPPGGAMLPPTTIAAGSHDPHFQLPAAAPAGLEALYRSGLTVTDPSSRLFVSGQYSSVYTTTGTTLSPYSQSLYSGHGSQPLSPYAAAYMYQWPSAYSPGAGPLIPGQYPHIESFSAVLQNLGSQHAQHSHLPRLPYVRPHIPHSPYPGTGSLTTTTDSLRVPAIVHRSSLRMGAPAVMEPPAPRKSPKRDQKGSFRSDIGARHSPHDRKSPAIRRYSPLPATQYRHSHHSPPAAVRDTVYRDADARHTDPNSARKHRILTHSPQMGTDPLSVAMYTQAGNSGAGSMAPPLLQRSRGDGATMASSVGQPPPLLPSHSSSTGLPQLGQSSHLPPLPPLHSAQTSLPYPADPHYPAHFMKGSIIQLANGELKRVEELRTDDFISSADVSADLKIDSSTVVRMEENAQRGTAILGFSVGTQRIQVTVEATLEHPFFVFGQGWSSCSPQRTMQYYSLQCHQLQVGDICISLTHKDAVTQPSTTSARHPQSGDAMISVVAPHSGDSSQRSGTEVTPRIAAVRQTRSAGLETSGHAPTRKRCWSAPGDIKSDSSATHGDGRTIGGSTVGRRVLTPGVDESAMKRSRAKTPPPP